MAAEKKTNGHDPTAERIVELLEKIHVDVAEVRNDLSTLKDETRAELLDLRGAIGAIDRRLTETNHEIADIAEDVAALRADVHELKGGVEGSLGKRVGRLEDAVFKRTGT